MRKARDLPITREFLQKRADSCMSKGYGKQKWVEFCEHFLAKGYFLTLYEARETFSKYVKVHHDERWFRVRFSNHKPNRNRELNGDCDFFVGWTHTGIRTTAQAIQAVEQWLGESSNRLEEKLGEFIDA